MRRNPARIWFVMVVCLTVNSTRAVQTSDGGGSQEEESARLARILTRIVGPYHSYCCGNSGYTIALEVSDVSILSTFELTAEGGAGYHVRVRDEFALYDEGSDRVVLPFGEVGSELKVLPHFTNGYRRLLGRDTFRGEEWIYCFDPSDTWGYRKCLNPSAMTRPYRSRGRFLLDGTFLDESTGLIWRIAGILAKSPEQASQLCGDRTAGDRYDWRLPEVEELGGIYELNSFGPIRIIREIMVKRGVAWATNGELFDFHSGTASRFSSIRGWSSYDAICVRRARPAELHASGASAREPAVYFTKAPAAVNEIGSVIELEWDSNPRGMEYRYRLDMPGDWTGGIRYAVNKWSEWGADPAVRFEGFVLAGNYRFRVEAREAGRRGSVEASTEFRMEFVMPEILERASTIDWGKVASGRTEAERLRILSEEYGEACSAFLEVYERERRVLELSLSSDDLMRLVGELIVLDATPATLQHAFNVGAAATVKRVLAPVVLYGIVRQAGLSLVLMYRNARTNRAGFSAIGACWAGRGYAKLAEAAEARGEKARTGG
jgi:hypothetical protein